MQTFLLKFTGLALIAGVLLFSACEEDPIVTTPLGPDIQLVADPGFVDGDTDVEIGSAFDVKVTIFTGDAKLQSLEIFQGTDKLATARFTINGGAITSNNPFLITGADKDGATYEFRINPGTEMVNDINTYSFEVTDEAGETDVVDVVITTVAPPGTPIDMTLTGILLNQAGPAGTGGLSLDDGQGTGSLNTAAEIRDMGIDCTIAGAENWRAQFGTVNGAVMVKVDQDQVENFTFDNVDKKEAIQGAYDTGIALSDGISYSATCVETAVTDVSGAIAVDDMFVVLRDGVYYLIRVDEVNPVGGSNGDNIVFSIKY